MTLNRIELRILLHYATSGAEYSTLRVGSALHVRPLTEIETTAHVMLVEAGLLRRDEGASPSMCHHVSDKGQFFLDHLMNTPIPETQYYIPDQ